MTAVWLPERRDLLTGSTIPSDPNGASCNLELELDTGLFQDLEGLQQVVKRAYTACNQAVNDELARL